MKREGDPQRPENDADWVDPLGDIEEAAAIREDLAGLHGSSGTRPEPAEADSLAAEVIDWSAKQAFEALNRVASAITSNLDLRSLVKQVLDAAIRTLRAERGIVFLGHGGEIGLVPILALNLSGEELDDLEGISRTILATGRLGVVVTDDALSDLRFRDIPSIRVKQIRSVACAPMIASGEPVGVIYLDAPSRDRAFPQHCKQFLEAFARLAAVALKNARLYGDIQQENARLRRRLRSLDSLGRLVAVSPQMTALMERAAVAALVDEPVLILGESGTEKELLARLLHELSPRALDPFVAFNCAALPRDLIDDFFVGRRGKGAARAQRGIPSLLRQADRGVLFLDEVTRLDPGIQGRLARFLEDGILRRAGRRGETRVDIRLITTISRDARSAIEDGCLLEGLHNRINAVELHIPPLRERPEDVPVLAKRFLKKHTAAEEEPAVIFTVAALEFLQSLPWHGNVAELESLVQRVLVFSDRGRVDVAELERVVRAPADGGPPTLAGMPDAWRSASSAGGHFKNLAEQEREAIRAALIRARGNKSKAARLLGIHRNTLLRRMKKLRISWKRSAVGPADPGGIGRRYAPW